MEDQALIHPSEAAWKSDVSLEMWIDAEHDPVRIRLIGVLDHTTSTNLVSLVKGLIADGLRDFEFETALQMSDVDRSRLLVELKGIVQASGARLKCDGSTNPWLAAPAVSKALRQIDS